MTLADTPVSAAKKVTPIAALVDAEEDEDEEDVGLAALYGNVRLCPCNLSIYVHVLDTRCHCESK
jgi:hypothetical protein